MKTFAIMALGCKVNDYESTYIKNELIKDYQIVDFKSKADIYIIFTCCVTNTAEAKTRKYIHQARNINPKAYIVAIGCLAQIKPNLKEFSEIDLVVGSANKNKVIECVKKGIKDNLVSELSSPKFENLYLDKYPGKDRAFLKIQDGCNQFCSYCIIPYARGSERSANHLNVIEQAKKLSKNFKEIVLTGIHTGRYNDGEYNLYNLLFELDKIDELETIRISSIEITEISNELIDLIASSNKIAKHLHIPVQSCSDSILKQMHRPYTIEEYMERVSYIRSRINDISISTDLIVGFPGESEMYFNETKENLEKIKFSFIHIFPYSRKSGTIADNFNGHVEPDVKKNRVKQIKDLQKPITFMYKSSFINKIVDVLIEKAVNNTSYGYSKQYFYVEVDGLFKIGSIIKVKIISVSDKIIGEYVS